MLEKSVEDYLVKRVEANGGIALKGDVKGRRFLDRICIMPGGVTGYAECKRDKTARRRPLQTETVNTLNGMGHIAFFLASHQDVDHFMTILSRKANAILR